jgi:hypothetical protein
MQIYHCNAEIVAHKAATNTAKCDVGLICFKPTDFSGQRSERYAGVEFPSISKLSIVSHVLYSHPDFLISIQQENWTELRIYTESQSHEHAWPMETRNAKR